MSRRIYTRTGDQGETGLFSGQRLRKSHVIFEALGGVDELNAKLGTVRLGLLSDEDTEFENMILEIQSRLIDIGSSLATPRDTRSRAKLQRTTFETAHVERLETFIDGLESQLPKLTTFILPSGGKRAMAFHEARTVCRRAERAAIRAKEDVALESTVMCYLNRLSDLMFMCARYYSQKDGYPEHTYRKPRTGRVTRGREVDV